MELRWNDHRLTTKEQLRRAVMQLRARPIAIVELIPLLSKAADEIEALQSQSDVAVKHA